MEEGIEYLKLAEQFMVLKLKFAALESVLIFGDSKVYQHYAEKVSEVDKDSELVLLRKRILALSK